MAKINNQLSEVLTASEVSEIKGVSIRYVQQQCEKGNYICRKAGKTWLILKSSVMPILPKVEEFKPVPVKPLFETPDVIMKMNKQGAIGVFNTDGSKWEGKG